MAIVLAAAELDDLLAPTDPDSPAEAVRWFRARAPVSRDAWDAMDERARRRAFTLAHVTALDIVTDVWRGIDRAIARGDRFSDFRRDAADALRRSWAGDSPGRAAVVFRNATQGAYTAGRYAQMTEPDVLASRPFWRFEAILDSRTSPICQPLDGLIRPASDAWWATHYPPLHHQCRSGVTTLSAEQAAGEGGAAPIPGATQPAPGWGAAPSANEWEPDPETYPPELWRAFREWTDDERED